MASGDGESGTVPSVRATYARQMTALRETFDITGDGRAACRTRSLAVDDLVRTLWHLPSPSTSGTGPASEICIAAIGGYGRQHLFPCSDVDLLFCTGRGNSPERSRDTIRQLAQALWDCGLKVSPATRALADLEPFKASDPEFSLALLDVRFIAGNQELFRALEAKLRDRRSARDSRALAAAAAELTRERHARFGNTLFHLEPNIKDAPGGLRDANICTWLRQLRQREGSENPTFDEALDFITAVRTFLHLRHGRDDNTLDWHAQDEAAAHAVGLGWKPSRSRAAPDASSWMRAYFRQARAIQHELVRELDRSGLQPRPPRPVLRVKAPPRSGLQVESGVLDFQLADTTLDPAREPDIVLAAFALLAETGVTLSPAAEERIEAAVPALSGNLEDGPRLWSRLRAILLGPHAGTALRAMHALGILELLVPEFHGIDALVIRDAYHRYTVDEHTFVLVDVLHQLAEHPPADAPEWRKRFSSILAELPQPEILYLAALLHDTGKGRAGGDHAVLSSQLAEKVCARLELGAFETTLVTRLIDCHLEMSAALRRDIFDNESVRVFADKVQTHDLLRMLTLFTYADISAVHPDALTPWKAENLWRLSMAAANALDRSVDEERVHAAAPGSRQSTNIILRALGRFAPSGATADPAALEQFLEGFPERYLRTRPPDVIRQHMAVAHGTGGSPVLFRPRPGVNELTVVTRDRPHLFADLTAALAAWRMDVLSAEAFSNQQGCVIDYFRFSDTFRTLELNPEEHERFVRDIEQAVEGALSSRGGTHRLPAYRAPRRQVETRVEFDNTASSHSTLFQVVAQNVPGLLHAAASALSDSGCNVEVALIDSEGEMAIDVFYVTRAGDKLVNMDARALGEELARAINTNALRLSGNAPPHGG